MLRNDEEVVHTNGPSRIGDILFQLKLIAPHYVSVRTRTKVLLAVALMMGAISVGVMWWPQKLPSPGIVPPSKSQPNTPTASATAAKTPEVPSAPSPSSAIKFSELGVLERNAQLVEIRKKDLPEIFRLWLEANHVDQDLMKQGAIATAFAFELRNKTPSPELVDTLWRFVADETQSRRERVGVLGIFAAATTKEAVDFLVRAATTLQDKELRQSAMHQMMMVGDLWGDGTYHEERSPALERAWRETQDPDLLIACAVPMAEIGAPQAIASLLAAAIAPEGRDDMRKRSALSALDKVYGRNAIPPIAALFASQQAATPAAALAGRLLARIGNDSAANALVTWLRNAEDGAASLVPQLVQQTRTPEMLDAWTKAAEGNTAFRSERVREAIRDGVVRYHQNHRSEK